MVHKNITQWYLYISVILVFMYICVYLFIYLFIYLSVNEIEIVPCS